MSALNLERGVKAMMEQIDAPIASYFNSCVHCGLCADACLFYTETGDPKYTPIHKVEPLRRVWKQEYTFWGKLMSTLGLSRRVTDADLDAWQELVYDSCTLCGRCSAVCPVGNDIAYMVRKIREGFAVSGHATEGLTEAAIRSVNIGSPMGIKAETLRKMVASEAKASGIDIELDKPGVEYLLMLSSAEIMQFHEFIGAVAKVMDHVGATWTISTEAFEATNTGIQIGSSDIARQLVQRVVDVAEKLGVKTVISPECGHAYTSIRWEGPNLIGRAYGFEVKHIVEVLDEFRAQGRLHLDDSKEDMRLTFHDPCQMVRRGGVVEQPRRLLDLCTENFVEMPDAGVWNWCCGGGGGVSTNERAAPLRLKVFSRKKSQLDRIGAKAMVTTCSNCRNMLEEGLEEYGMEVEVLSLTELLAEHLDDSKAGKGAEA